LPDKPQPLTAIEKRTIGEQLIELDMQRAKVAEYKQAIADITLQKDEAIKICKDAIESEKKISEITIATLQKEIEIERKNAAFYKQMYETLLKKHASIGCVLKRIFTLGIARCN
jgi:hypothetical protein